MDTTDKEVTCISLFSGYGGLDLGVRRIIPNLRVIAYVEIEAYACELLAQKISRGEMDQAPIFTDVTKFPSEEFRDKVHLVIAGYPCQDFSNAGNRAGLEGERGKMWGFTRAVVNGCNARAFFGENVEGHLSLGFNSVVSDLGEDGFSVKGGLYSAFEVGAPHLRKRIFSLSFRTDPREEPWASRNRGNQGWVDIDELKFRALTTGQLADPASFGHEWSGRPDEGSSSPAVEGCGDGDGRELGDPKYHGSSTEPQLRVNEEAGDERTKEESQKAEQLEGADRPRDEESLHGGEPRGYSTIEGCIRQTMGYPINDGHTPSTESGETCGGKEEGRMQEPARGGSSSGALADHESLGHGGSEESSSSDGGGLPNEEGEVGRDIRREARGSSSSDGEVADPNSDGLHGEGDFESLGEEKGREGPAGDQSAQAFKDCCEAAGADWAGALARLYDEGYPGISEDGQSIKFEINHPRIKIRWPARPGQPQHEWEEPRTILGDSEDARRIGANDEHQKEGQGEGEHTLRSSGESSEAEKIEPIMGREPNAVTRGLHATRIERLRMLGNGVVWLTAAKAFSELIAEHEQSFKELDKLGKL